MEEQEAPGGHALQHLVEEWEGFRSAPGMLRSSMGIAVWSSP